MSPTTLPITFRALKITHDKVEPHTSLDGFPPIPIFMTVRGEYEVKSPSGDVDGIFVFVNVMSIYTEGHGDGTAYDGQQVFTGSIQGRKGAVAMRARGTHVGVMSRAEWEFVGQTASGELDGISGTGKFNFYCDENTGFKTAVGEGELTVEFG